MKCLSGLLLFLFLPEEFFSVTFRVQSLTHKLRYAFVLDYLRKPFLMEMSRDTDLSPLESTDKDPALQQLVAVVVLLPQQRGNPQKTPCPQPQPS